MKALARSSLPIVLAASCGGGEVPLPAPGPAPVEGVPAEPRRLSAPAAPRTPGEPSSPAPAARPARPEGARFWFEDVTESAGLGAFRGVHGAPRKPFIVDSVGGGVAFLDHDGDGDLDVYLTNGAPPSPRARAPRDALFVNDGEGRFSDGTEAAGLGDELATCGVAVPDVDGDGWPDLYLTNIGANRLYRNRGDGRFEDVTAGSGLADRRWSTGACFFDPDLDGDLDVYVANYVDFDPEYVPPNAGYCQYRSTMVFYGPRGLAVWPDAFYRNAGDGTFAEATEEAGLAVDPAYAFQVVAFDFDLDGDTDLFVGNDSVRNSLFENDGEGRFRDVGTRSGTAVSQEGLPQASMGVAVGDYDGDLRLDLFSTNFSEDYHTLYHNDGGGFFTDVTARARLRNSTMASLGWSCGFVDFDSDGHEDLFAVNGHIYPQVDEFEFGTSYRQLDQLFENLGNGRFREVTAEAGPGFARLQVGRGGAWGDYDGDGDVDLLVGNLDDRPALLENRGSGGSWLKVRLVGTRSNRDAVGATVELRAGGRAQLRAVGSGSGFLSASDPRVHFGLGAEARVDQVRVRWPGGALEAFGPFEAGRTVTLVEGEGRSAVRDG